MPGASKRFFWLLLFAASFCFSAGANSPAHHVSRPRLQGNVRRQSYGTQPRIGGRYGYAPKTDYGYAPKTDYGYAPKKDYGSRGGYGSRSGYGSRGGYETTNYGSYPSPAPSPMPSPDFGSIIPGSDVVSPVSEEYVFSKHLERMERGSTVYTVTLAELEPSPDAALFGDSGFLENGEGGISTYDIFTMTGSEVDLFGLRNDDSLTDVWFVDSLVLPDGTNSTFVSYSNQLAATCWEFALMIKCTFNATKMREQGIGFAVGSGGWRNTELGVCDYCPNGKVCPSGDGGGIINPQVPEPKVMQYVVNPYSAQATCCSAPANKQNLAASFENGCDPVHLTPPTQRSRSGRIVTSGGQ